MSNDTAEEEKHHLWELQTYIKALKKILSEPHPLPKKDYLPDLQHFKNQLIKVTQNLDAIKDEKRNAEDVIYCRNLIIKLQHEIDTIK